MPCLANVRNGSRADIGAHDKGVRPGDQPSFLIQTRCA
jgi:hypothetical protein